MSRLSAPKNVRRTEHRCCLNCKYLKQEESPCPNNPSSEGDWICKRSDSPEWGDPVEMHITICDGYKPNRNSR